MRSPAIECEATDMDLEPCTWCGNEVEPGDGFRAYEPARRAARGVLPARARDPLVDPGCPLGRGHADRAAVSRSGRDPLLPDRQAELTDTHVLLVRHRGEHRVAHVFCSVDHMTAWARQAGVGNSPDRVPAVCEIPY